MTTQLVQYGVNDIEKMARTIATSGLFGIKTPEQACALMLIAQAEGKHPATAAMEYNIIQGKPALKSEAMLARFQAAGGKVEWKELGDKIVTAIFSHPAGGSAEITWTIEMAKTAGFGGKDNWLKFPRAMLRARVISEGIRTVFPGVAVGVYTPEEVRDFVEEEPKKITAVIPKPKAKEVEVIEGEFEDDPNALFDAIKAELMECDTLANLTSIWKRVNPTVRKMEADNREELTTIKDNKKKFFTEEQDAA